MNQGKSNKNQRFDRIEQGEILLDGEGKFPKTVIIREHYRIQKYRIIKTKNGNYLFNK